MLHISRAARRVACGAGAFAAADLITGMAAYCVITLGGLWFFCWTWLRLASDAATQGVTFGSPGQLEWAWLGSLATIPAIPLVLYLAVAALRLPAGLATEARHPGTVRLRALFAVDH